MLLTAALGIAAPSFAQAPEPTSSASEEPGSVIVFPKFIKGTVAVDGVTRPQTEIEVHARCPNGATCSEDEPVKIRFHWVCPGSEDIAPKYVCTETDFDVTLSVNGKVLFNPEDPSTRGRLSRFARPLPKGLSDRMGDQSDHRSADQVRRADRQRRPAGRQRRDRSRMRRSRYGPTPIWLLAPRSRPRSIRAPALRLSSSMAAPAITRAVAGAVPANLEYHKLTGPLSSSEAFLILLTLMCA